jgi:cob(I)alamin adenosyltransferase
MKIYTKTGDRGNTVNFDQTPVSKSSLKIQTIGTIDELNSAIGLVASLVQNDSLARLIEVVQRDLFQIGSFFSGAKNFGVSQQRVEMLEHQIDEWEKKLPRLTQFILPGGSPAAAATHVARSVCRRAEREVVRFHEQNELPPVILQYCNRLSDWLFVLARYINLLEGTSEKMWEGKKINTEI